MTDDQFKWQIQRLESVFGGKYFDIERLDLIRQQVMWMEMGDFAHMVSHFIASFKFPPLPKDFKEAVIAHKNTRQQNLRDKPVIYDSNYSNEGLDKVLKEKYGGAVDLKKAIEIERLRIRIKRDLS